MTEGPNVFANLNIIDATLREGNQSPGVAFTTAETEVIARLLARVGVATIECGHAIVGERERDRIRALAKSDLGVPILTHARACLEDIDAAANAGAEWVGIFAGVSDLCLRTRFSGRSREQVLGWVSRSVEFARRRGLKVRYTVEDASRTPLELVASAFQAAVSAGADRLCFADTTGVAMPSDLAAAVRSCREAFPGMPLELHCHDDRGLALANALAAVAAGGSWVSTSVNGIGERCGIVDLAAFAANLQFEGVRSFDFEALQELAAYVGAITREPPDARRAVIGRHAFTHTARLHGKAVMLDEATYAWQPAHRLGRVMGVAAAPRADLESLIARGVAIPATELPHHREGPGTRYVMLDDRFVPDARQYCIVREVAELRPGEPSHVDVHRHTCDSVFLFIGAGPHLTGLSATVTLEGRTFAVESPASVLIPAGVAHSYAFVSGGGYYVNLVQAGSYAASLLSTPDRLASERATARARAAGVTPEEFAAAVATFVAQRSGLEPESIGPHFDYIASGVLDSISVIDLFFFVEDTFGGRFQPGDFDVQKVNTAARLYEHFFSTAAEPVHEIS